MTAPDRTTPPPENTAPPPSGVVVDSWIMKSLTDLREDMKDLKKSTLQDAKGIRDSLSGIDGRIASLERKAMRVVYSTAGAIAVVLFLWAAFSVAERYFDITIRAKAPTAATSPGGP